jgi:hypothetical protein
MSHRTQDSAKIAVGANVCRDNMMQRLGKALAKLIILLVAVILSPLIVAGLVIYGFYLAFLYLAVWATWCRNGSRVFVCYSRSPHWQARFEKVLIPKLPASTIIVNWSDRKRWSRLSLRTRVFGEFLGSVAHTPSVIIFRPFRRARVFRFHEAYKHFKHGNPLPVEELESALLSAYFASNSINHFPSRSA